jgi:hypothetical protein
MESTDELPRGLKDEEMREYSHIKRFERNEKSTSARRLTRNHQPKSADGHYAIQIKTCFFVK